MCFTGQFSVLTVGKDKSHKWELLEQVFFNYNPDAIPDA